MIKRMYTLPLIFLGLLLVYLAGCGEEKEYSTVEFEQMGIQTKMSETWGIFDYGRPMPDVWLYHKDFEEVGSIHIRITDDTNSQSLTMQAFREGETYVEGVNNLISWYEREIERWGEDTSFKNVEVIDEITDYPVISIEMEEVIYVISIIPLGDHLYTVSLGDQQYNSVRTLKRKGYYEDFVMAVQHLAFINGKSDQ